MRPTIADIAKEAGLTPGTVSRALSAPGKYYVSTETRERAAKAASKLGYRPNFVGKALAAGASGLICLLANHPFSSYYTNVARQLAHHSARDGYCLVTDCALDNQDGVEQVPRQEWLYGVDGIIACDPAHWHQEYLEEAHRLRIPMVHLGTAVDESADSVVVDLYEPSRILIRHLMEQGCESIAFVTDDSPHKTESRARAYRLEMERVNRPVLYIEAAHHSRSCGREAILRHQGSPFDAVFCANDEMAIGAYRALIELGRSVPQDVAVAGCDGIEDAAYQHTPITTLTQPLDEMCAATWDFLKQRMGGSTEPPQIFRTSAKLEIRASTLRRV
jgi:LacI family transcriptional regulator